jgi:hypothetical protein
VPQTEFSDVPLTDADIEEASKLRLDGWERPNGSSMFGAGGPGRLAPKGLSKRLLVDGCMESDISRACFTGKTVTRLPRRREFIAKRCREQRFISIVST